MVCYTSLISGYCGNGLVDEARKLFEGMPERNDVSYSAMISGFVQNKCFNEAIELFQRLGKCDIVKPNRSVLASVLNECGEVGAKEGAGVRCYLVENSLEDDVLIGTALIDFFAKCGNAEKAEEIFDQMLC